MRKGGLGLNRTVIDLSQILWFESRVLRYASQHFWPNLFALMEGKNIIRPSGTFQGLV